MEFDCKIGKFIYCEDVACFVIPVYVVASVEQMS